MDIWRVFHNESGILPDEAESLRGIQCLHIKRKENAETCLYDGRCSVVQLLQEGTVLQGCSSNTAGNPPLCHESTGKDRPAERPKQ